MPLRITHADAVTVLRMDDGENRFNPDTLKALNAALDDLSATEAPAAAVLTGTGKFFSNGLDLDWMQSAPPGAAEAVIGDMQELFARLLLAPVPVVAALNGHAFAGGGMLALACDERIMRTDRGFFCLPEVAIGLPFTDGLTALITARLAPRTAHATMTTGQRYPAAHALAAGIVDAVTTEEAVLPDAIARAAALAGTAGPTLAAIKQGLYGPVAHRLRTTG